MKEINYQDCEFKEEDPDLLRDLRWFSYPCHHPQNIEQICYLRNKAEGQTDLCPFIRRVK